MVVFSGVFCTGAVITSKIIVAHECTHTATDTLSHSNAYTKPATHTPNHPHDTKPAHIHSASHRYTNQPHIHCGTSQLHIASREAFTRSKRSSHYVVSAH